jgi:hypothetical protein
LFLIIVATKAFPATIPQGILVLLGISSSSYLVSKGIQFSSEDGVVEHDPAVIIAPTDAAAKVGGDALGFQAETVKLTDKHLAWTLDPQVGSGSYDDATGIYTYKPPPAGSNVTVPAVIVLRATSVANPKLSDVAAIRLS